MSLIKNITGNRLLLDETENMNINIRVCVFLAGSCISGEKGALWIPQE